MSDDMETRVAALEAHAAAEEERIAAIVARNRVAYIRESRMIARHGMRPCTCDPKEGCNAP